MKTRFISTLMALVVVVLFSMQASALDVVIFGSDMHCDLSKNPNRGLDNFKDKIAYIKNSSLNYIFYGLVGDQVRKSGTVAEYLSDYYQVRQATRAAPSYTKFHFCMGNHDKTALTATNKTSSGEAFSQSFADIFEISVIDLPSANDLWNPEKALSKMFMWLLSGFLEGNGRIKVIMFHYPLHSPHSHIFINETVLNTFFDQINGLADSWQLDIVLVTGHSHGFKSTNLPWDKYTNLIATPGGTIATCAQGSDEGTLNGNAFKELKFTVINGSYLNNPDDPSYIESGDYSTVSASTSSRTYFDVVRKYPYKYKRITRIDPNRNKW